MSDLVENMFFFGEIPWHGKGTELKEIPTSEKAIVAAGLDWKVTKERLLANVEDCDMKLEDYFAIRRSDKQDSKAILGVVGKRYTPVQNKNAFSFFDTIVGEKKAIYHTAGSLDNGKCIWILAKLPDGLSISSNDNVELYTLLMNRHDGQRSVIIQPTPIRVVCNNTLSLALSEKSKQRLSFRHTANVETQMRMAALSLNYSLGSFEKTKEAYRLIAKRDVNKESLSEYFDNVIDFEEQKKSKSLIAKKERLNQIFDYDVTKNGLKPSLWIAYNAVTYWVDHEKGRDTNRLSSAWLGGGFLLKQKALNEAVKMAA